jgi:hypothetical protein
MLIMDSGNQDRNTHGLIGVATAHALITVASTHEIPDALFVKPDAAFVMLIAPPTFGTSPAWVGTRDTALVEPRPPNGMRVLFIGNSLTYVNDLPWTVSNLAARTRDAVQTAQFAFPDYALEDHAMQGDAVRAINHGGWHAP